MELKDSATIAYSAEPQVFTVSILKDGVMDETAIGSEPNAKTKKIIEETDAGIGIAKFNSVKRFMEDLRN